MTDSRKITREELHALVWQRPVRTLAAEFGMSDVGLAKLCQRLDVPRPPRGHWARLAAGKASPMAALPERGEQVPRQAIIRPSPPAAEPDAGTTDAFTSALARLQGLKVPERLARPHPVIAGWIARKTEQQEQARANRARWGSNGWIEPDFTKIERRMHRILDALFKALERAGGSVVETDRRELQYQRDGVVVGLSLREKHKVEHQPLSEEERRDSWNKGKTTRRVLVPTGRLILEIRSWHLQGTRTTWLENDDTPFEDLLAQVAASVLAAVPQLVQRERQRAHEQRLREEQDARRREIEAQARREAARWDTLVTLAGEAREVELVRALVAALEEGGADFSRIAGGRSLGEWLEWARAMIAARDPLRGGAAGVFERVGAAEPAREQRTWR